MDSVWELTSHSTETVQSRCLICDSRWTPSRLQVTKFVQLLLKLLEWHGNLFIYFFALHLSYLGRRTMWPLERKTALTFGFCGTWSQIALECFRAEVTANDRLSEGTVCPKLGRYVFYRLMLFDSTYFKWVFPQTTKFPCALRKGGVANCQLHMLWRKHVIASPAPRVSCNGWEMTKWETSAMIGQLNNTYNHTDAGEEVE